MNCETFEESLMDLAREAPVDRILRAQLLAHAESCGRCRARLEAETALTATFRLAAADSVAVPDCIETALLAAYRGRPAASHREVWRFPLRYAGIAATVLLALAGAAALTWFYALRPAGPGVADAPVREAPRTISSVSGQEQTEAKTDPQPAAHYSDASKSAVAPQVAPRRAVLAEEFATDFIPLAYSSELSYLDSGQLVRVLLPRNAMASYGIPVNQELADGPVTAQVLIGQDGVARAIRFLGDPETRLVPAKRQMQR
jgi:hypothetical protein